MVQNVEELRPELNSGILAQQSQRSELYQESDEVRVVMTLA